MKSAFLIFTLTLFGHLALAGDPAAATTLPAGEPAARDGSVYELDSDWLDQNNKKLKLADLGDKVRVVVMGYTSCQYACPRLIADLIAIEKGIEGKEFAAEVGYSFISIDPENDTPEKLKKLEGQYKFTPGHWRILTGDEDGVLELAVALGMKYRKTTSMDFAHSNIITVLRCDGTIAHQQVGLETEKAKTYAAISAAVKAK
ncbi:SCO family protein [Verrucomicrobiales bacterium BCK34]|nr:SCO family protein [Verrucomicrobiales bacterium BCK34]